MYDIEEITDVLTDVDKFILILFWSYRAPIDVRVRFMRDLLLVRLNTYIEGFDIMEYNLRFQIICNRQLKELNLI
jgi:hypothetical protein